MLVYSTGIARNELICGYASEVHSVHTHTLTHSHTHTHTHTHSYHLRTANCELTGLKVDIAEESSPAQIHACQKHSSLGTAAV